MKRREFLNASSSALLVYPGRLAPPGTSPKFKIRVGFIGASYSHAADKLKLLHASQDWDLVGVCDESGSGRETCRLLGVPLLPEADLLKMSEVVVVESDICDHARHALLALRAGRHVHVEKPPAMRLSEMHELVGLAREKSRLLQSGYMWRQHPGFAAIFEAVRQGWMGEVFMVRGHIANNLTAARRPEWAELKGGAMFEQGSHLVDAMVRLLGEPTTVTPFTRHHGAFADSLRDNNIAVLEYPRALAVITNSTLQSGTLPARSFEVLGTKGSAVLQPIEPPGLRFEFATAAGPYRAGVQTVPLNYQRYTGDFVELAAAVRGERALSVDLDTEWIVQKTLLRVSDMMGTQ